MRSCSNLALSSGGSRFLRWRTCDRPVVFMHQQHSQLHHRYSATEVRHAAHAVDIVGKNPQYRAASKHIVRRRCKILAKHAEMGTHTASIIFFLLCLRAARLPPLRCTHFRQ